MEAVYVVLTIILFVALVLMLMKRLNASFSMLFVGVIGLLVFMALSGQSVMEKSTGNMFFDAFSYFQTSMVSSFTMTGITLITVLGYVAFMNKLKASDMFAITVAKPISKIKSKYVIIVLAMLVCCVIKWVIPSAVTSFLMAYACIYPVLRHCGIRRVTAICTITVSLAWSLGPGQPFTGMVYGTFAPEVAISAPEFFVNVELRYFIPVFIVCAVSFILTTKYFEAREDKKPYEYATPDEVSETLIDTKTLGIPGWYGLLPIIPLVLVIIFGGTFLPIRVGVVPIYLMCGMFVILIECVRRRTIRAAVEDYQLILDGMGESWARYAAMAWAGAVFADAIGKLGGLDILMKMLISPDLSVQVLLIVGGIAVFVITALTGQPNLGIFGLTPVIVAAATFINADLYYVLLPIAAAATGSNILSVAAPVALVSAEKGGIPVTTFIVRQAIPCICSGLAIILCCAFMF
ncbi:MULTISPECIES: C4-dicarboxylate transporter DcuC [unclassified Adlercreutzia]|uniref:C4-dicarboxylate transporter DcuC n=1 Tax=unclassified Adlercreutzia TaxID=2636013 RepID=UPI0013EC0BA5|nr:MULTISPECIES: C4-dicarboxylate transporter DcuC [unclassified Adlercreutzia]